MGPGPINAVRINRIPIKPVWINRNYVIYKKYTQKYTYKLLFDILFNILGKTWETHYAITVNISKYG